MKCMRVLSAIGLAVTLAASAAQGTARAGARASPQEVVAAFSALIEAHRGLEAVNRYVAADFIEHDPSVPHGDRAGMIEYLKNRGWMDPGSPRILIHRDRTIASGPYVVVHQHLRRSPASPVLVIADFFRVEQGKIVEHWDVMQPVPLHPANGRYSMY
jgi:predicted SnoaL-like aldol condensation-catalyzing enzyme